MPVLLLVAAAVLATADPGPPPAAPAINPGGIVNAATNQAPENFVSPEAITSIYGTGLASVTRELRPSDIDNRFLPETLPGGGVFAGGVAA